MTLFSPSSRCVAEVLALPVRNPVVPHKPFIRQSPTASQPAGSAAEAPKDLGMRHDADEADVILRASHSADGVSFFVSRSDICKYGPRREEVSCQICHETRPKPCLDL